VLARLLGDDVLIERVVFDGPSRVIDLGHARTFTGAVRRAVELRDRHCTFPGCHAPAARCEVDHIVPHAFGGPTSQANGRLGCRPDHRHRHRRESGR
jgi:5-methylcytosine-specific restriction endonuclease McrA